MKCPCRADTSQLIVPGGPAPAEQSQALCVPVTIIQQLICQLPTLLGRAERVCAAYNRFSLLPDDYMGAGLSRPRCHHAAVDSVRHTSQHAHNLELHTRQSIHPSIHPSRSSGDT